MMRVFNSRLDVVTDEVSASNDFSNKEESVELSRDDTALCDILDSPLLPG